MSVAHAQDAAFCDNASTCLTSIVYLFAVYIPTNFAYAAGYLFNAALQLALNSASYALNFLSLGWTIVRDIANLTFIFILIYIAYIIIMRAESSGTMRMLAWVVAMALLINFSFFITRIVIDAGNILSVQFYNAISIPNTIPSPLSTQQCPPNCIKDLTGGIMDAVKVQSILGDKSFNAFINDPKQKDGIGTFSTNVLVQTLVFVSVGIFLSLLGFVFLIVGIKFIVRVVVLWLTIVASPLAFAAHALPSNKKVMGYYQMWQDNLIQSAFYPAVFLFLFFIMNLFLVALAGDKGLVPNIFNSIAQINNSSASAAQAGISVIANIGVRMGLVIVLLYFAMKASDAFSSMGSGMANSIASWTGSKAANMTAGTSSWLARNSAGRLANAAARSATVRDWAAKNPLYGGRLVSGALNKAATSSLDIRGIGGLKSLVGKAGFDLSGPGGKGGYRQQEADRAKAAEKFAKGLKSDAIYIKQNALAVGKADQERIKREGVAAAIREYQEAYDSKRKPGEQAFHERMQNLEKARVEAERAAAAFKASGDKTGEAAAQSALMANNRQIAELQSASAKKYTDAEKALAELAEKGESAALKKIGENRIKDMDKKRINEAADYEESRRFGNMYMPSVGNIEGAMKMSKVASGKTDVSEAAEHLLHAIHEQNGGGHGKGHDEEKKQPEKKTEKKGDAKPKDEHPPDPHHLTLKGIQAAAQHYGSNEAAGDAIMEKIKRLDLRMRNVQENTSSQGAQMAGVQQSLNNLQRQRPSTPTSPTTFETSSTGQGTLRPKTGTTVVGGADEGRNRRMPTDRGEQGAQRTIDELANSTNDKQNPPEAV
ncbi:hypothetical protein K2Q00_01535 [Patescibacteria group bacterium]|nr:hypothetical protein [Patescibacteria group bacterium]